MYITKKYQKSGWRKRPTNANVMTNWLINDHSLTARLQAHYSHFAVKPILVKYARPITDEAKLLKLPAQKIALIREVLLMGNHQPVVFAHSVLPHASLRGAWHGLGKLGNKPLGATLFANPKVKRTPLAYKKLPRHHPISMRLAEHLKRRPSEYWARRSIFSLNRAKILVTEVFLPHILLK